ncbi:ABC transporter ATP-binding protein [Pelagibius litoralis]|uniref:ABC transporter ATP-binding protein n=1 Tax=Pelagibius litoralis TaxID=374515 RepID=A0A967EWZ4_9PROT|nr:ABC transporter ATP-binding protein [Pelagibius litoralis]NIA69078.1 ABC transporter ATP-binding protein [Pelagibius litoralis]
MSTETAIEVRGLWKRYGLPMPRLLRRVTGLITRASERTDTLPWALQDVSFTLRRGENLGIIGRNGAGKSTLLKVLAGVSPATKGEIDVRGRVFPMIELQAGANPNLTGRENIMLLGAVMGFSPREIRGRYDQIAEFSELGSWLERPVRMYSSGMLARLGISVALHSDSDLLMIDEVFGVGDYKFQQKCIRSIERLVKSETITILFVSHSPYAIQRLCDKVLLLDRGEQAFFGRTQDGLAQYFNAHRHLEPVVKFGEQEIRNRDGAGTFRFDTITFMNEKLELTPAFYTGQAATFEFGYRLSSELDNLSLRLRIFDNQNTCVTSLVNNFASIRPGAGKILCRVDSLNLMPGTYLLDLKASNNLLQDSTPNTVSFSVQWPQMGGAIPSQQGLFYTPASWALSK